MNSARIGLLMILSMITTAAANAEKPTSVSLSGTWKMQRDVDQQAFSEGWQWGDFDDGDWHTVKAPGKRDKEQADIPHWYRRTIIIPPALSNDPGLKLVFQPMSLPPAIFINGRKTAVLQGWNTPMYIDMTENGGDGNEPLEIQLTIAAKDWYSANHFFRDANIRAVHKVSDFYMTHWFEQQPRAQLKTLGPKIMYSVYVRNFSPEGTFDGLRKRLPELKALGIDILWLLPIHKIGEEKRKGPDGSPYAIEDYYSLDPNLGDEEDFRTLVKAVHEQDMQIIIDCVLRHTSPDSVLVREHRDWFLRDDAGNPIPKNLNWWDIVDLDWNNREVWNYCYDVMEYWVKEFDIDGYRADVAYAIPHEFWSELRRRLEKIKSGEIVMLAESDDAGHHLNGFDITYNNHLYGTMRSIFQGRLPATALNGALLRSHFGNPNGATRIIFTENHDKQRAINAFGGVDQARLAAVLVATLPGMPLLYTGTEVGADADRNETFFTRSAVDFANDSHGLRGFWNALLALRENRPALQVGELKLVTVQPQDQVFAFERVAQHDRALVVVNIGDQPATVELKHELMPTDTLLLGPWQWAIF